MNDYISDADSQVTVNLASRSYSIEIKPGLLNQLSKALGSFVSNEHVILVTDSNVAELYLESVVSQISEIAQRVDVICVNPGEESKSIPVCNELWQQMVDFNTDRQSVVVALGGGVVGDLAGFLAASFARGIRFIQIPTTLLAQVDSSVGGARMGSYILANSMADNSSSSGSFSKISLLQNLSIISGFSRNFPSLPPVTSEPFVKFLSSSSSFFRNLLLSSFLSVGIKIVLTLEYFKVRFGIIL